jgi:hypothetical protein
MELAEFNNMTDEEREELILGKGQFIASRTDDDFRVLLYGYDHSYFEVWCSMSTLTVYNIEMLEDNALLDDYLDDIGLYEVQEILQQQ